MCVGCGPRVSVIIPSVGRAERLAKCVEQLAATTQGKEVECIAVVDSDNESTERLMGMREWLAALNPNFFLMVVTCAPQGAIQAWNRGLRLSTGDLIVFAGDDLEWSQEWLHKAEEVHARELGNYGMVGFNDEHNDGNTLATHYLADRKFIKDILGGRIGFPLFHFYCNDTVANFLAKRAGCFHWAEDVIVRHAHYTTGRRQKDSVDAKNEPHLHDDILRYEAWIQRGGNIEWESEI